MTWRPTTCKIIDNQIIDPSHNAIKNKWRLILEHNKRTNTRNAKTTNITIAPKTTTQIPKWESQRIPNNRMVQRKPPKQSPIQQEGKEHETGKTITKNKKQISTEQQETKRNTGQNTKKRKKRKQTYTNQNKQRKGEKTRTPHYLRYT